ncbi:hypothetical protein DICA1_C12706 [Diutina catenulata]
MGDRWQKEEGKCTTEVRAQKRRPAWNDPALSPEDCVGHPPTVDQPRSRSPVWGSFYACDVATGTRVPDQTLRSAKEQDCKLLGSVSRLLETRFGVDHAGARPGVHVDSPLASPSGQTPQIAVFFAAKTVKKRGKSQGKERWICADETEIGVGVRSSKNEMNGCVGVSGQEAKWCRPVSGYHSIQIKLESETCERRCQLGRHEQQGYCPIIRPEIVERSMVATRQVAQNLKLRGRSLASSNQSGVESRRKSRSVE